MSEPYFIVTGVGSVWVGTELRPADWREREREPQPEPPPPPQPEPRPAPPVLVARTVTPSKAERLREGNRKQAAWMLAYTRMSDIRIARMCSLSEEEVAALRAGEGRTP